MKIYKNSFVWLTTDEYSLSSLLFWLFRFWLWGCSCRETADLYVVFLDVCVDVFPFLRELLFETFNQLPNLYICEQFGLQSYFKQLLLNNYFCNYNVAIKKFLTQQWHRFKREKIPFRCCSLKQVQSRLLFFQPEHLLSFENNDDLDQHLPASSWQV